MLPFTVSPSVSNLVVHVEENGPDWVEFNGWYKAESRYERIRIKFQRLIRLRTGGKLGIGEIKPSDWLTETIEQQRRSYPNHANLYDSLRHFYVGGHDIGFEFLADGFSWETIKALEW